MAKRKSRANSHASTFALNLEQMMKNRGIKPTPFRLQKAEFTSPRAKYLLYGDPKSIRLEELYRLCFMLHCTPFELLKIPQHQKDDIPDKHPLQPWIATQNHQASLNYIKTMPPEKLAQAEEMLRKLSEGDKE